MPQFRITDNETGISLLVSGDNPPSEAEAQALLTDPEVIREHNKKFIAKEEQGRALTAPSMFDGGGLTPREAIQGTATAARYGAPVMAGIATGGAGFLPAMAATAGAGAIGELAAQRGEIATGERSEVSGRDIATAAITSPMGTPLRVGSGLVKAGANIGFNAALGEAGLAVQNDGFQAPQSVIEGAARFGLPAGIGIASALGDVSRDIGRANKKALELSDARKLAPGEGVLVSEVVSAMQRKGASEAEQRLFRDANKRIHTIADQMTVGLSDNIQEMLVKNGFLDEGLADELAPFLGKLKDAEMEQAKVSANLAIARENLASLEGKQLAPEVQEEMRNKVRMLAAQEVEKNTLRLGVVRELVGARIPTLAEDAGAVAEGALKQRVSSLEETLKGSRDKLYAEQVGIDINEPVVSRADFEAALANVKSRGEALKGDDAMARVKAQINKVFGAAEAEKSKEFIGFGRVQQAPSVDVGKQTISRERFLNFRDTLAKELADESTFATRANKIAAEAYEALTDASNTFLRRTNPEKADALKRANKIMADIYGSRSRGAIEALRDGKMDKFAAMILDKGPGAILKDRGPTGFWAELDAYVKAGTRLASEAGDEGARAATEAFYNEIGVGLKNTIATRSLDPATSLTSPVIDMARFTGEYQTLLNRGVKPEWLQMNPEHVKAARAMAERLQGGMMEPAQLDQFLDDAAKVGVKRAETKLEIEKLAEELYVNQMRYPLFDQQKLRNRIIELSGGLKAAEDAISAAKANPIVQLLDGTGLGVSNDPMQNGQWVSKMIVAGPNIAGKAVDALIAGGRGDVVDRLRKAAVAHVFSGLMESDVTKKTTGGFRVKPSDVKDYFNHPANRRRTETLRALLGSDRWDNLEKLRKPIEAAADSLSTLQAKPYQSNVQEAAVLAAGAGRTGGLFNSWPILLIKGVANSAAQLYRQARYSTLHLLYIDPVWSKRFEAAGRNVEKFIQNPAAAVAYRLATQQDDELAANGNARP